MTRASVPLAGLLRVVVVSGVAASTLAIAGCSAPVDIPKALQLTNVVTGYYDAGIVSGKNKLVPSISFQVKNVGARNVSGVQLNAVFRVIGDQQELGSAYVKGIGSNGLQPSATSDAFVLRSTLGYTGEQPRTQMLQHKEFKDVQTEVFAKYGSDQWVKLGQFKVDRQLLTQ